MTNVIVWYLLIAFTSSNGVATIPQVSEAECQRQAKFIMDNRFESRMPGFAYCVPGVKQ